MSEYCQLCRVKKVAGPRTRYCGLDCLREARRTRARARRAWRATVQRYRELAAAEKAGQLVIPGCGPLPDPPPYTDPLG